MTTPTKTRPYVIDNIGMWRQGRAKLDVRALYDYATERFGQGSPTDWVAEALWLLDGHELLGHFIEGGEGPNP